MYKGCNFRAYTGCGGQIGPVKASNYEGNDVYTRETRLAIRTQENWSSHRCFLLALGLEPLDQQESRAERHSEHTPLLKKDRTDSHSVLSCWGDIVAVNLLRYSYLYFPLGFLSFVSRSHYALFLQRKSP